MIRFLKELFNPRLKCERVGHSLAHVCRRIRRPGKGRIVCNDFDAVLIECDRCDYVSPEVASEVEVDWFNGVTMPNSMWDEMKINGFVRVD